MSRTDHAGNSEVNIQKTKNPSGRIKLDILDYMKNRAHPLDTACQSSQDQHNSNETTSEHARRLPLHPFFRRKRDKSNRSFVKNKRQFAEDKRNISRNERYFPENRRRISETKRPFVEKKLKPPKFTGTPVPLMSLGVDRSGNPEVLNPPETNEQGALLPLPSDVSEDPLVFVPVNLAALPPPKPDLPVKVETLPVIAAHMPPLHCTVEVSCCCCCLTRNPQPSVCSLLPGLGVRLQGAGPAGGEGEECCILYVRSAIQRSYQL